MKQKIFEEHISHECEGCQHYWNSTCDGYVGTKDNKCKSFEGTEMTYLEQQVDRLQRTQLWVLIALIIYGVIELYQMIRMVLV